MIFSLLLKGSLFHSRSKEKKIKEKRLTPSKLSLQKKNQTQSTSDNDLTFVVFYIWKNFDIRNKKRK